MPILDKKSILEKWNAPNVEEYLTLYRKVGEKWGWSGRLLCSGNELKNRLHSSTNEVWKFYVESKIGGFFEIDYSIPGKTEIVYMGLLPEYIGKGYGKSLLDSAVAIAGRNGQSVWLHTCEYDHPKALDAYLKAGFEVVSESVDLEYYPIDFIEKHQIR